MKLEIRRATVEDLSRIERFTQRAYPDLARWKYPERWEWQYLRNPFNPTDEIPFWLALSDGEIVGQLGATYMPMRIDGDDVVGAHGSDLIVLPEYRGRTPVAPALKIAQRAANPLTLGLWISKEAEALNRSLGFKRVQPVQTLRAHRMGAQIPIAREFEFDTLVGPGRRTDELWERLAPLLQPLVSRNAPYLEWKYLRQPFLRYELYCAVRGGEDRALVVMRSCVSPEPRGGVIADLLAAPDDSEARRACIGFATNELSRRGSEMVVGATNVPAVAADYQELGFSKVGEVTPWFYSNRPGFKVEDGLAWFVTRADSDGDQFPGAAWRGGWSTPPMRMS